MFPNSFLWGAANAAPQVEGGLVNNWNAWERRHAESKAQTYPNEIRGTRFWPAVKDEATDPEAYVTGKAVDHYNRYEEDFDIAASLNHNAHRLSIAWERLMPAERGVVDEDAVQHYHDVLDALHNRGIEPIVTLWHFSHPQWFEDDGGWLSGDTTAFDEYVQLVVDEYDDKVSYWVTLNEPQVFAGHAYGVGEFPPGNRNPWQYWKAERRLLDAHIRAYKYMAANTSDAQIGLTLNLSAFDGPNNVLSRLTQRLGNYVFNDRVADYAMPWMDFIGVNCYFYRWTWPTEPELDGVDAVVHPRPAAAVGPVLRRTWERYNLPIIITENGVRDPTDEYRWEYTRDVLRTVHDLVEDGVDIRGYLHWALLDNYAWQEGFWTRMGLVHVDRHSFERTVRPSAEKLGEVYRTNERP